MKKIIIVIGAILLSLNLFTQSNKMKIITLVENNVVSSNKSLKPEHGISMYISFEGKNILFDLGRTDKFVKNANVLGVDIEDIDYVIISHAHLDHGGGLEYFFKINKKAVIYLHENCKKEYFYRDHYIGLDRDLFKKYKKRFRFINKSINITKNLTLLSVFDKKYLVPENKYLMMKDGKKIKKDDFNHEIVLTLKKENEIIAFTGCSHSGILNMADAVKKKFPQSDFKAILGGFHLMTPGTGKMSESKERVIEMAENLKKMNIQEIYTGHCTGNEAFIHLKSTLEDKIKAFKTGTILEL